jgi:Ca2+-binding EF-hand superfamily protein
MVLTQEEIDACREAFLAFDKDRSGTIDVWELRQVLEELGQAPTEDELFQVRYFHKFENHFFPSIDESNSSFHTLKNGCSR